MKKNYGVKSADGSLYGPYSLDEARRVSDALSSEGKIVTLRGEEMASSRELRVSCIAQSRRLILVAYILFAVSAYLTQGPGVLLTAILSPRAFEVQSSTPTTGVETATSAAQVKPNRMERADMLLFFFWGFVGCAMFALSGLLAFFSRRQASRGARIAVSVFFLLWMSLLLYQLWTSPSERLIFSNDPRDMW